MTPLAVLLTACVSVLLVHPATAQSGDWRTIEFETTEVTAPDVAISPDGEWLIFTLLGHLFRLPVEGGTAEQLTFGPFYDSEPVFSPDGSGVAFVSDRDGSEGNVFLLNVATGRISQVTHEPWAARPSWTPDGQAIVYLSLVRESPAYAREVIWKVPAVVRRLALSGGDPESLSPGPPQVVSSVFYLPDARLAWTVIEREAGLHGTTRIEVMDGQGAVSTLRTVSGIVHSMVASPAGDGLYGSRSLPLFGRFELQPEDLVFLPLPEGDERQVVPLSRWDSRFEPRFAVARDNNLLYVGKSGRLWKVELPSGAYEPIAFGARVRLEVHEPTAPPGWAPAPPGIPVPPRGIRDARLSPDGLQLVFGAARYLWQQPLDGGPAERLPDTSGFAQAPAFSPDGRQLAFVHTSVDVGYEIRVLDFEAGTTRTVPAVDFDFDSEYLSWSPDGRLVLAEFGEFSGHRVVAVNPSDGQKETLAETSRWEPRPHFSADGRSLYFSADTAGNGTLYRLRLGEDGTPEPLTQLAGHLHDALVSPNGKWLAFRRNMEIWVAPLGSTPVTEDDVRQFTRGGGRTFAFTPDGEALIYAAGNAVWRQPLTGVERDELAVRLELPRPTPAPLLLRRVRVLDFAAGGFGVETAVYLENGRIRWIGSERGRMLPPETVVLDADGRFAIPGLFDMHVHAGWAYQPAFLAYGITSLRDTGGWLERSSDLADRGAATSEPVPRYFFSGEIFEGASPIHGESFLHIRNEDDARRYIREWNRRGAHFIKTYESLPWPLCRAVAEEARRLGLPVVGHGYNVEMVTKSVTLGYAGVEHSGWENRFYDDVLQMLALAGTRWDPTLGNGLGLEVLVRDEPERLAETKYRAMTPARQIRATQTNRFLKGAGDHALHGIWAQQLAAVRAAHHRGVRLQAGSHAPWPSPVVSLHWELEAFVEAGIPPLEVLRIATQQAAEAVGADDHLGTLEVGKLADIVLLDANPLDDIRNTETIWRVIKGGWVFDPEELAEEARRAREN